MAHKTPGIFFLEIEDSTSITDYYEAYYFHLMRGDNICVTVDTASLFNYIKKKYGSKNFEKCLRAYNKTHYKAHYKAHNIMETE